MGKIQKMIDYAVAVAKDNKHGYSQVRRWPKQGTDFDCASLMYQAAKEAGYNITVGPAGTHYTGTMIDDFKKAGFKSLAFDGNLNDLDPGDILVRDPWGAGGHTEMYIGNGKFVGAHVAETGGTDGKPGDQTGDEISVCNAYGNWDYVLVPPKETTTTKPATTAKPANRLNGIDISSWQEGIDVAKVSADFIIVKVSGGTSYVNDKAHGAWKNWRDIANAVLKAGKLLGLYHYACEYDSEPGGKAEAEFFLKQIKGFEGKAVLCLDWEAHAQSMPVSYAKAWLDTVAKATGCTPMFYGYASYLNSRDHSAIKKYPLWMASYLNKYANGSGYVSNPENTWGTGSWDKMTMYQYSSTRTIKGYSAHLDCNVFYGTKADWEKLAKTTVKPAPEKKDPSAPAQPRYRVKGIKKWGQWKSAGQTATAIYGIHDVEFSGLPTGSKWRLTLDGGKVLAWNTHNTTDKALTGVEIYYNTANPATTGYWEAVYRVHALNGSWGKWEYDLDDGGAGGLGVIDKLQFKIAKC